MKIMARTLVFALALGTVTVVACGGGDSKPDAGDVDAPPSDGTLNLSWLITDGDNPLTCADVAAITFSVRAIPNEGGFASTDALACGTGSGTTLGINPGLYRVEIRLAANAGNLTDSPITLTNVEVVAGQSTALGEQTFVVAPQGNLTFKVDTVESGGNCEAVDSGGAGLTEIEVQLRDSDGCVATAFSVQDGDNYNANCTGSKAPCTTSDKEFSATDVGSGPHTLVITGYRGVEACYGRTAQFPIPGNHLTYALGTQQLEFTCGGDGDGDGDGD